MKIHTVKDVVTAAYMVSGALGDAGPIRKAPTGLSSVDEVLGGGLMPGTMTVLGARTNVGKSTTLVYMCRAAELAGFKPAYISLEDADWTIGARYQSFLTKIPTGKLLSNGIHYNGTPPIAKAIERASSQSTTFAFPENRELSDVIAYLDVMKTNGSDLFVVDYLTAISSSGTDNMRLAYSQAFISLKSWAQNNNVPLILACQMSREPKAFNGKPGVLEPTLSDLSETKMIEEGAEVVILLWNDSSGNVHGKVAKIKYGTQKRVKFESILDEEHGRIQTKVYWMGK